MTPLVRYTGPRAAYLGAIGEAVCDESRGGLCTGVRIAGRVIPGQGVPPLYQLSCGADVVATWSTWAQATADLAMRVPADLAGHVLEHEATAAGFAVCDGATVWRLEPV